MGVFSEMAMEQFEPDGYEPFQLDPYPPETARLIQQDQVPHVSPNPPGEAKEVRAPISKTPAAGSVTEPLLQSPEKAKDSEQVTQQSAEKADEKDNQQSLINMSDEEVMIASARRVSNDTEKITRRNMKDCVSEVIQTKCLEDPAFARLVIQPRKSMVNCFKYITRKAWEYVQDELKADGITPENGAQGYGCDVPDDLCYQWAEDYFRDPEAQEDKTGKGQTATKASVSPSAKKQAKKEERESKPKKKQVTPTDEGQITMDFNQLGKAG